MDVFVDGSVPGPPDSIKVVGDADLERITRAARSTRNHWIKQRIPLSPPDDGLYGQADMLAVACVMLLVEALGISGARAVWERAQSEVVSALVALDDDAELVLAIDSYNYSCRVLSTAADAWNVVTKSTVSVHPFTIIPIARAAREWNAAFWARAQPPAALRADGRRRASRKPGVVRPGRPRNAG